MFKIGRLGILTSPTVPSTAMPYGRATTPARDTVFMLRYGHRLCICNIKGVIDGRCYLLHVAHHQHLFLAQALPRLADDECFRIRSTRRIVSCTIPFTPSSLFWSGLKWFQLLASNVLEWEDGFASDVGCGALYAEGVYWEVEIRLDDGSCGYPYSRWMDHVS